MIVPTVFAESIGTFQINEDVEIYQECNNCTYCNFTRVKGPTGANLLTNLEATEDGTYYHFTVGEGNITDNGVYSYCYDCGNTAEKATGCLDFEVTYNGLPLTSERATLYIGLIGFLFLFFVLTIFFIPKLPQDKVDDNGLMIEPASLKYLKPILIAFAWMEMLAIVFLTSNVALAYLPFKMFGDFLFLIFQIMFWTTIVAIPIWFINLFIGIFRHKEMKRLMERGVEFGGKGL